MMILLTAGMVPVMAQMNSNDDMQTLFGNDPSIGVFLGFGSKMSSFNKEAGMMLGGELAMTFGHSFNIGVHGYGLVNEARSVNTDEFGNDLYYTIGYGGLTLEPVFFSKRAVHFSVPVLIGAGGVGESRYPLMDPDYIDQELDGFDGFYRTDFFFYVEPGVNAEVNLMKFVRLYAGVSYRLAYDIDLPQTSDANMSSLGVNLGLRVGVF
ncbi:MAG: hypothetical protein RL226_1562 [Bacteroidota bacterium]